MRGLLWEPVGLHPTHQTQSWEESSEERASRESVYYLPFARSLFSQSSLGARLKNRRGFGISILGPEEAFIVSYKAALTIP